MVYGSARFYVKNPITLLFLLKQTEPAHLNKDQIIWAGAALIIAVFDNHEPGIKSFVFILLFLQFVLSQHRTQKHESDSLFL